MPMAANILGKSTSCKGLGEVESLNGKHETVARQNCDRIHVQRNTARVSVAEHELSTIQETHTEIKPTLTRQEDEN